MWVGLQKYNVIAVAVFIGIIIIAHLSANGSYSWKTNTVSELAAQGYERKWIMQIGFVLFGLILIFGIIYKINYKQLTMKTITINLPEEVELDKVKMIIAA